MKILIFGGAGFIGCNTASAFLEDGHEVIVFDNLMRKGTEKNLQWLKSLGGKFTFIKGDIRNYAVVKSIFKSKRADIILHFGAQVAVTSSIQDPRQDFEINALGTINILEAMKKYAPCAILIYASTNKVYGNMNGVEIIEKKDRYEYKKLVNGISERQPCEFLYPYGCSKGCADQYVLDYSRVYRLNATSLRQSCIYGIRQFGNEDQGWVAHFIISSMQGRKITIYGDGKQVRDLLYIEDLVDLFMKVIKNIDKAKGKAYNIGGGPQNAISLLGLINMLERKLNKHIKYDFAKWRPGDQKAFICDISRVKRDFNWKPKIGVEEGVDRLIEWVSANKRLFTT